MKTYRYEKSMDFFDLVFNEGRTHSYWQDKSVEDELLEKIYDLAKLGPTSANCSPLRVIFVKSIEEKDKLCDCMMPGNVEKTRTAPVTALFAHDLEFYEKLPTLFPIADMKPYFSSSEEITYTHALRNGSLQAAYFILAARSLGLDCGPMSGFDEDKVNQIFFKDTSWKINFICNLGYGEKSKLHPRHPRLTFNEACRII